jgi:hypothetical protein
VAWAPSLQRRRLDLVGDGRLGENASRFLERGCPPSLALIPLSYGAQAEINESVESDAFVIPSSSGRPDAGRPPFMITRSCSP